jgi:hypothetical protein
MKRCPTCQKTFDDNLRFCQVDGTPLVDDAPPPDPYKTMVASREDIQAALSGQPGTGPDTEQEPSGIGAPEDGPLEIPSPAHATPESEFETKLAGRDDAQVIEIPPLADVPPEPPKFNEPAAPPPSFGGSESAPPFSAGTPPPPAGRDFPTTPPIPSPFSGVSGTPSTPSTPDYSEPEPEEPTYFEPEPEAAPPYSQPTPAQSTPFAEPKPAASFDPFGQQSASSPVKQQWDPPGTGGTGMTSPPPASTGQKLNQTLPIVSLVAGILGLTLCCGTLIPSVVAIIAGIMGRGKATNQPQMYGGAGLALAGIITGVVGILGGLVMLFIFIGPVIAFLTAILANAR